MKVYETGHFDRSRTWSADVLCAEGTIRHAREYAYYDVRDVVIDRVIFYRFLDAAFDTGPPPAHGLAVVAGQTTVMVTASLSEFFAKLYTRTAGDTTKVRVCVCTCVCDGA